MIFIAPEKVAIGTPVKEIKDVKIVEDEFNRLDQPKQADFDVVEPTEADVDQKMRELNDLNI